MTSASAVNIRPALPSDAAALGRLGATLMRLHHGFDAARFMTPPPRPEQGYGEFLVSQLGEPDALVLVAERDGEILGYCYAALEPRSWKDLRDAAGFIHDVIVDEHARGQGLAGALIRETLAWMKHMGAPRVVLSTAEANPTARAIFARMGFRPTMVEMTRELDDLG